MPDDFAGAIQHADSRFSSDPVGENKAQCESAGANWVQKEWPEKTEASVPSTARFVKFCADKSMKCDQIVFVQFLRQWGDGQVINAADVDSQFEYMRPITTAKGWVIDCWESDTTPIYSWSKPGMIITGDTTDHRREVPKEYLCPETGFGPAEWQDEPSENGGNKKGFKTKNNPNGWKSLRCEFFTYVRCAKGNDMGKWYGGWSWEYIRTWEDFNDEKKWRPGTMNLLCTNLKAGPSEELQEALDKFNANPPGRRRR